MPTTMMIAALMLALGFTVVAMGFNHLNVSARLTNAQYASNLADSAIAKAIEEIILDEDFGTPSGSGTLVQVTLPNAPADAVGVLSFDETEADGLGINYSFNNLDSDTSASGDGREVPPEAVHLVAAGRCNGVERKVEAVIYVPRFPYGLAANGPINSEGGLLVAEVADASVLDGGYPIPDDQLLPGNVATNATDATTSIDFKTTVGNISIKGDLQSRGGASLNGAVATPADWASIVEGETRLGADQVDLPDIDLTSYAPNSSDPDVTTMTNPPTQPSLTLSGVTRSDGDLTIANDLDLNGGVLYVQGNLTVNGGIKGKGAVVATGHIGISGNSSATSDNRAALLSGTGIDLVGTNKNAARFEGLVYSHGPVNASNITLSGTAVSTATTSSSYTNVDLYQVEEFSDFTVTSTSGSGSYFDPNAIPNKPPISLATFGNPTWSIGPPVAPLDPNNFLYTGGELSFGYGNPHVRFVLTDPVTGAGTLEAAGVGTYSVSAAQFPITIASHTNLTTEAQIRAALEVELGHPPSPGESLQLDMAAKQLFWAPGQGLTKDYKDFRVGGGDAGVDPGGGGGGGGGGGPTTTTLFSVRLSDFLNLSEKLRVLYWKEQRVGE
ncbi:MAG: hypothetical protein AB7S38_00430 [Vulcanimicrobiota bacterium]